MGRSATSVAKRLHRSKLERLHEPLCQLWIAGPVGTYCEGRLHAEHPIPAQRLINEVGRVRLKASTGAELTPEEERVLEAGERGLVADPRNGMWICSKHHQLVRHGAHLSMPRQWLPISVADFAGDYGLEWSLERDFPALSDEQADRLVEMLRR